MLPQNGCVLKRFDVLISHPRRRVCIEKNQKRQQKPDASGHGLSAKKRKIAESPEKKEPEEFFLAFFVIFLFSAYL